MKRRDFIRQNSWFAGGLLLHQQMLKAFATDRAEQKLNIGIIGCGDRGSGIISVMKELPDRFEVKAICDVLDFRFSNVRKSFPELLFTEYHDYRKLLDDKTIPAVVIAVPLNLHYQVAADALKAGKHVYLEKTMTYSDQQALDLVRLASRYPGQILQVGHQYRYTPLYFKVKEMIEKGYLGKVTQIHCRWDRNWNWRRPVPPGYTDRQINWRMYRDYSGGLPAELLSHQIDFINWAFDTHPDEITGAGGIDFYKDGRETYDNVQAILRYNEKGMIGNFGATCANEREGYVFQIKGNKGTVSLLVDDGVFYPEKAARKELETVDGVTGATRIEWNKDGGIPLVKEKQKDGTWYALQEFYKVVTENGKPVSNVITGATTAFCVHQVNQAIYNKRIENWKTEYNLL